MEILPYHRAGLSKYARLGRECETAAMEAPETVIMLDLGLGDGRGEAFGCDLSETYVIENSEYTT